MLSYKNIIEYIFKISIVFSFVCQSYFAKLFYINLSGSIPVGLYRTITGSEHRVGDLVVFDVPAAAQPVVYGRNILPEGWPLMKYIAALHDDIFCVHKKSLFINQKYIAAVLEYDSQGEPLSHVEGCHKIGIDEFLPISTYIPHSYDGRYFGAVPLSSIRARAAPVWTF